MHKQRKQFCRQSILLHDQLSSKADRLGVSSGWAAGRQEGRRVPAAPPSRRVWSPGVRRRYLRCASGHEGDAGHLAHRRRPAGAFPEERRAAVYSSHHPRVRSRHFYHNIFLPGARGLN